MIYPHTHTHTHKKENVCRLSALLLALKCASLNAIDADGESALFAQGVIYEMWIILALEFRCSLCSMLRAASCETNLLGYCLHLDLLNARITFQHAYRSMFNHAKNKIFQS